MRTSRNFMVITLCLMLLFSMFPLAASANQTSSDEKVPTITKDNVQTIIKSAQQGDEKAIKAINSLDCFNPEKLKQKGTLSVSSKEENKKYDFDDGSSITLSVGRETNSLKSVYYTDWGMAKWEILGVEIGRYLIYHRIELDSDSHYAWSRDHWDDSDAIPGYTVQEYGTELYSGNTYDICWDIRGAGKYTNVATGSSGPKYIFEFHDDVAGNSNTLDIIYP